MTFLAEYLCCPSESTARLTSCENTRLQRLAGFSALQITQPNSQGSLSKAKSTCVNTEPRPLPSAASSFRLLSSALEKTINKTYTQTNFFDEIEIKLL